jgi:hypothetical protein
MRGARRIKAYSFGIREGVMETAIWAGVVGGSLAALTGAFGNQLLAARANLKARRLELYFRAKADAYRTLLEHLAEFGLSPRELSKYLAFLGAFETALLFASDEVAEALSGRSGVHVNAQRLRTAADEKEREAIAVTTWYEATRVASSAMHEDLKRLSGGFQ